VNTPTMLEYVKRRLGDLSAEHRAHQAAADQMLPRIAELEALLIVLEKPMVGAPAPRQKPGAVEHAIFKHLSDGRARNAEEIIMAHPAFKASSVRAALRRMTELKRLLVTNDNYHVPEGQETA
jgi:hypothetical protein